MTPEIHKRMDKTELKGCVRGVRYLLPGPNVVCIGVLGCFSRCTDGFRKWERAGTDPRSSCLIEPWGPLYELWAPCRSLKGHWILSNVRTLSVKVTLAESLFYRAFNHFPISVDAGFPMGGGRTTYLPKGNIWVWWGRHQAKVCELLRCDLSKGCQNLNSEDIMFQGVPRWIQGSLGKSVGMPDGLLEGVGCAHSWEVP